MTKNSMHAAKITIVTLFLFVCNVGHLHGQHNLHNRWDALLNKYVMKDGRVDYRGLKSEVAELNAYLNDLDLNAPDPTSWSKQRQLAYWINAYNAFTVKLIVDHYPVKSIKDLNPVIPIPFFNTIWQEKLFTIGGKEVSLDDIEHGILRQDFNEPRIHFAINCASVSCPVLLNEAYAEERLETQLTQQAESFVNDRSRNSVTGQKLQISQIFNWFRKDFTKKGTLIDFINQYSKVKAHKKAEVTFLDYDWSLNDSNP